ncbi:hypothetical protein [Streptomyces viridochromogenes]|uniref:hypothetical protein n=1 Tax=Streptomyces viridochromogenes TaxID=1938 RepID=UPI0031DC16C0
MQRRGRHHPQPRIGGGRERAPAAKGLRNRTYHHQADWQLDRDQVVTLPVGGVGGEGEQLPHRERLFL